MAVKAARTAKRRARQPAAPPPPLRLEWRSPAELAENPANWRRHPEGQVKALAGCLDEVGWAGACLFNERTGRLIDGHARKKVASERGDERIPVLVGSWTEEQERLILATLDPLAAMAQADGGALAELLKGVHTDDEAIKAMLAGLAAEVPGELPVGAAGKEFDESVADDVAMVTCPECGHEFPK